MAVEGPMSMEYAKKPLMTSLRKGILVVVILTILGILVGYHFRTPPPKQLVRQEWMNSTTREESKVKAHEAKVKALGTRVKTYDDSRTKVSSLNPSIQTQSRPLIWNKLTADRSILVDVSYDPGLDRRIDNMKADPLPVLSNYRSPCWFESLNTSDPYPLSSHTYVQYFKSKRDLQKSFTVQFSNNIKTFQEHLEDQGFGWRQRCLPHLYLVGINRGGSTALWGSLTSHPHITSGTRKELHYWNEVRPGAGLDKMGYSKLLPSIRHLPTPRPLRVYMDLMDSAAELVRKTVVSDGQNGSLYHPVVIGDATPNYLTDFDGWEKMEANIGFSEPKYTLAHILKMLTPSAKILATLRNPVDRLVSEYLSYRRTRRKSATDFNRLVNEAIGLMTSCLSNRTLRSCVYDLELSRKTQPVILKHSMYLPFVKDWMEIFGNDQMLVVRSEQYYTDVSGTTNKVFAFLGLDSIENVRKGSQNQRPSRRVTMHRATLHKLYEFFKPFNRGLAEYLGDEGYLWPEL